MLASNPSESPRRNMSQVDSSSHTFKKSPKPLSPVPSIQVNYNTTSKTFLRHPSMQVRGVLRHMIKRYVRITSDPKSRPNQSPKCSPFKQIRVQPLRHHQDSSMNKLEVMEDIQSQDMSRSPINQKLIQINYLNPGYIAKYYWKTLRIY